MVGGGAPLRASFLPSGTRHRRCGARYPGASVQTGGSDSRIPRSMALDSPALEDAATRRGVALRGAMNRLERFSLPGGVFAVALVAAALVISLLIQQYLEPDTFLLFLVAVWLSAWYYGRAIGFLAVAASAVALTYLFLSGTTP